jgi:plasmid maintenance system killer protein
LPLKKNELFSINLNGEYTLILSMSGGADPTAIKNGAYSAKV